MPPFSSRAAFADQQLLLRYPMSGVAYDELVDQNGSIRPHWRTFVNCLESLGPTGLAERWEQARQLIHDNGISFNVYGDPRGMERPWQLSPIPVLIAPDEFASISAGLTQRARLLDRLLADLYGEKRALTEGWLPPELVLAHPGFLRPCDGLVPPHGRYLHFYAADLVRRPSGVFHVLTDRTQAPAGAGYALENRIVMSRVLPDVFRDCNVARLATFFRTMRETLASLAPAGHDNPRIVLLSPGPYNATYFEQAFLAQYLGYMLVDGADLTVRDSHVFLKTLGGLHPVDVILRRLNGDFCDPLELRDDSTLGIPGLLQAVRAGHVAVANTLGSGVLQTAAIVPFLPRICRGLLDEDLKLPSVETWWCGDPVAREHVLGNLAELVLKPAYPTGASHPIFGEALGPAARDELKARVRAAPALWVAQARVPLSTTPVIDGTELQSRQLVLRSFLVSREGGAARAVDNAGARAGYGEVGDYDVMPGALSLVGVSPTEREISMQRGAGSNDTWVVSGGPVSTFSLLPRASHAIVLSRGGGDLPSRVADNLFWLGRYSERADAIARLARTVSTRLAEQPDVDRAREGELGPLLAALREQTRAAAAGAVASTDPMFLRPIEREVLEALFATDHPGTLRSAIESTHRVGRVVRDRISTDTWRILTSLQQELAEMDAERAGGGSTLGTLSTGLDRVIMRLAALGGVVMESMTRGQAWRFLDMGRRLERAMNLVVMLRAALSRSSDREAPLLESVLDVADSGMTYRRRYLASLAVVPVVNLLVTDETNPRSVIFQPLQALADQFPHLPHDVSRGEAQGGRATADRIVVGAVARLQGVDLNTLCALDAQGRRPALAALLEAIARDLPALSDALSGQYLSHAMVSRQLAEGFDFVIYRVVHITEYSYAESVATSHHLLHLAPRDTDRQVCLREALVVSPTPATRAERVDHFGNRTTYFEIQEPHRRLTVESRRDVELAAVAPPPSSGGPEWESVRDLVRQPGNAELLEACEMTYQSPFARVSDEVARYAAPSFRPRRPLLDAVADLTHRIYEDLAYDPTATVVSTPVDEVLRLRRGVCQDFTHLEIACLRAMGVPARYVSGYLVTHAAPGKPRLVGADASHAWLAVYSPGDGWVPTDPTNDVVPDQRHITLAWGRDFGDVTPMRGVIVGGSRHELRVSVDVSPLGDDGAVVEERPLLARSTQPQTQSQSQSQNVDQDGDQAQDQPGGGAISERAGGGGDETTTAGSGTSAKADRQSE